MAEPLVITRVTHSCHLIQIGGMTVLTDPWFTQRPFCHQGEPYPRPDAECSPERGYVHHEFVEVRFCDLPGTVQHFTVPAESFDDKVFTDGLMFDGSSIRQVRRFAPDLLVCEGARLRGTAGRGRKPHTYRRLPGFPGPEPIREWRSDVTDTKREQTFVLVPGAWLGGWSWQPVARLLTGRGYPVLTLTLPGLSYDGSPAELELADAVDYVVSEVERRDLTDVVLVGHSWGGYPATGAAHRLADRVAKVIYFSAVVPEQGTSMADENEQYGEIIRQAIKASPDATVPVGLDVVQGVLMPGDPAPLQELVSQLLVPQPGGYMTGSLDLPPVTEAGLDAAYVLCADDIALARPGTEFAARLGVDPLVIPGNHMTMLTRPATVADALLTAL